MESVKEIFNSMAIEEMDPILLPLRNFETAYSVLLTSFSCRWKQAETIYKNLEGDSKAVFESLFKLDQIDLLAILNGVECAMPKEVKDFNRARNARTQRAIRVRKRIENMLALKNVLFLTLTFGDPALADGEDVCFARCKAFAETFSDYVFNADYGDEGGRLHFHGCVPAERIITYDDWPYGFFKVKKVGKDLVHLSRYIAKLGNHATKSSAKQLIYKRSKRNKPLADL